MRRIITTGFITIVMMIGLSTISNITILNKIADLLSEETTEVITITYEKQQDGDMIYEFGDVSNKAYFFIIINEEQGQYEYYWPAMREDYPLSYESLAELQESVICHIDQEWPNATFVMR